MACEVCINKGLPCEWDLAGKATACSRCKAQKRACVVDGAKARVSAKRRKTVGPEEGSEEPQARRGLPRAAKELRVPGSSGSGGVGGAGAERIADPLQDIARTLRDIAGSLQAVVQQQDELLYQHHRFYAMIGPRMASVDQHLDQIAADVRWNAERVDLDEGNVSGSELSEIRRFAAEHGRGTGGGADLPEDQTMREE
jgi:hypothetical protein